MSVPEAPSTAPEYQEPVLSEDFDEVDADVKESIIAFFSDDKRRAVIDTLGIKTLRLSDDHSSFYKTTGELTLSRAEMTNEAYLIALENVGNFLEILMHISTRECPIVSLDYRLPFTAQTKCILTWLTDYGEKIARQFSHISFMPNVNGDVLSIGTILFVAANSTTEPDELLEKLDAAIPNPWAEAKPTADFLHKLSDEEYLDFAITYLRTKGIRIRSIINFLRIEEKSDVPASVWRPFLEYLVSDECNATMRKFKIREIRMGQDQPLSADCPKDLAQAICPDETVPYLIGKYLFLTPSSLGKNGIHKIVHMLNLLAEIKLIFFMFYFPFDERGEEVITWLRTKLVHFGLNEERLKGVNFMPDAECSYEVPALKVGFPSECENGELAKTLDNLFTYPEERTAGESLLQKQESDIQLRYRYLFSVGIVIDGQILNNTEINRNELLLFLSAISRPDSIDTLLALGITEITPTREDLPFIARENGITLYLPTIAYTGESHYLNILSPNLKILQESVIPLHIDFFRFGYRGYPFLHWLETERNELLGKCTEIRLKSSGGYTYSNGILEVNMFTQLSNEDELGKRLDAVLAACP